VSVYLITDLDIFDAKLFAEYQRAFPAIVERHSGRYLVRGGEWRVLSGDWDLHRVVVFEFPDQEAMRATFDDPEYQPMIAIRERSARSKSFVVEGVSAD
jgi:uncharacterized protein (DUF1330 family)